ncbi:MAG: hypothetical protein R6U84_08700 [Candidatus Cloacimonadales bacterium]
MKNLLLLRILDLFQALFVGAGLDYVQIRSVLQLKLLEGSRRSRLNFSQARIKKISKANRFGIEYIMLAFLGLLFAVFIASIATVNPFISFTTLFTINGIFILLILFNEFYIIFFDLKDSELLLATTLRPQSLAIAKNLYLFITFLKYSIVISAPSLIFYSIYFNPLIFLPILLMIMLEIMLLMSLVSMLYALLLKFFSGEKLKDISTVLQVGITLLFFIIYQMSLIHFDQSLASIELSKATVSPYYPISWFAGLPCLFLEGYHKARMLYLTIAALSFSSLFYLLFAKYVGPYFEKNLHKLEINVKSKEPKKKKIIFLKFFQKFDFGIFYELTHKLLSTDRKIKTFVYPPLILSLFLPLLLIYSEAKEMQGNLSETKYYFMGYVFMLLTIQQFIVIYHSSYHKASWIFRYLPLRSPGIIYKGAFIGTFMKYQALLLALAYIAMLAVWGVAILPEVINMLLNLFISILLFKVMSANILPFSRQFVNNKSISYNGTAYLLVSMVFFPVLGGIHYIFSFITLGSYLLLLLQAIALFFLWRGFAANISWDEVVE